MLYSEMTKEYTHHHSFSSNQQPAITHRKRDEILLRKIRYYLSKCSDSRTARVWRWGQLSPRKHKHKSKLSQQTSDGWKKNSTLSELTFFQNFFDLRKKISSQIPSFKKKKTLFQCKANSKNRKKNSQKNPPSLHSETNFSFFYEKYNFV